MSKAPDEKVFKDIYETKDPLIKYEKLNSSSVYRFRVIEAATEPKIRIDVREYIRTGNYVGWTSRGLTMTDEQVDQFIEKLLELKAKSLEVKTPKTKATKKAK